MVRRVRASGLPYRMSDEPHFLLACGAKQLSYDYQTRKGTLQIPALHVTDMSGCVTLFSIIDPRVAEIDVRSEDGDRMRYVRDGDGWRYADHGPLLKAQSLAMPQAAVEALSALRDDVAQRIVGSGD